LKGLDLINQQEYVYENFAKKDKIKPEQIKKFFEGIEPTPSESDTWYSRAVWERQVTYFKFRKIFIANQKT
jgi:hypothetical protein